MIYRKGAKMQSARIILISSVFFGFQMEGCTGPKGKTSAGIEPTGPGLPIIDEPKNDEMCKKFTSDGIIEAQDPSANDKSKVKIAVSEGGDSKFVIECLGIITK